MADENNCKWNDPSCGLHWLGEEFKAFWLYVYDSFMNGLSAVVDAIPVPDFLSNVSPTILPSSVAWFVEPFNLGFGLSVVVSAYIARFIVRRLPFIG